MDGKSHLLPDMNDDTCSRLTRCEFTKGPCLGTGGAAWVANLLLQPNSTIMHAPNGRSEGMHQARCAFAHAGLARSIDLCVMYMCMLDVHTLMWSTQYVSAHALSLWGYLRVRGMLLGVCMALC